MFWLDDHFVLRELTRLNFVDCPRRRMSNRFSDYNPSEPPVHQVERIEGKVEHQDQWVIPSGHDDQRDHVDDGQDTGSVSEMC